MSRETGTYDINEELAIQKEIETINIQAAQQARKDIPFLNIKDEYFDEPVMCEKCKEWTDPSNSCCG